jgi:hypothetical protein
MIGLFVFPIQHSVLQFKSLNDLASELDNSSSINKSTLSLENVDDTKANNKGITLNRICICLFKWPILSQARVDSN